MLGNYNFSNVLNENGIVKSVILKWDSDFTKVTSKEADLLQQADEELRRGEVFSEDEIDWD